MQKTSVRRGDARSLEWLRAFEREHGRSLRVLHVGNIANNAFLNAKFLRTVGIEAHVVSYDYDHVMATPEWEEVELVRWHKDDFDPTFSKAELRGYQRPSWFFSGSLAACQMEIASFWGEHHSRWRRAAIRLSERFIALSGKVLGTRGGHALRLALTSPRLFFYRLLEYLDARAAESRWAGSWPLRSISVLRRKIMLRINKNAFQHLIDRFNSVFPQRADRLTIEDIVPYNMTSNSFRNIFHHYDIVQCYATEPIHALLCGKKPYVAFEHGTLRHFTMNATSRDRLTALAYRSADHTFITNGDCLAYAKRLGIEKFSPMIHPIDVEQHRQDFDDGIEELRKESQADVLLFCPTRHDWDIKGTDRFIRALPLIKRRLSGRVKMILVEWGLQVEDSKSLLAELGCLDDIIWKKSMCRITMIKQIRAADVVFDQMVLPVFGSTAPQAIAAGKPVVASYVPEETLWLIPKPAPILSAFSPEEVASAVEQVLSPGWLADYQERAKLWIDTYHHPNNVILSHLAVYQSLLEGKIDPLRPV